MNTSEIEQSAVTELHELHRDICDAARTTVTKAIRAGEILSGIRDRLKHGEWLPWLKANAPFSERTARNYICAYGNRLYLKSATVADLTEAYRLPAPPESKLMRHMKSLWRGLSKADRDAFNKWAEANLK